METEKIATGVVRTTHGLRGFLKVKVFSEDVEHFLSQKILYLRGDGQTEIRVEVEQSMRSGDAVLMKLKGIDTPEAGKKYNGWNIWIYREDAAPLDNGEYYVADLVGCSVFFEGILQGEIVSAVEGAQAELLEIRKADSGELVYVPFMDVYIASADTGKKSVELRHKWIIE